MKLQNTSKFHKRDNLGIWSLITTIKYPYILCVIRLKSSQQNPEVKKRKGRPKLDAFPFKSGLFPLTSKRCKYWQMQL